MTEGSDETKSPANMFSPWVSRSAAGSRRQSLALPSPSVFANMIREDSDSSEEEDGDTTASPEASSSADRAGIASLCAPSPLVLKAVDRNQFDGYIRRAQDQERKVRIKCTPAVNDPEWTALTFCCVCCRIILFGAGSQRI